MRVRRKGRKLGVAAAVVTMMTMTAACRDAERATREPLATADADSAVSIDSAVASELPAGVSIAMVEAGRRSFRAVCAPCHGPVGEGTQLGPPLQDGEWIHGSGDFDEIVEVTRSGVAKPEQYPVPMPVLGGGGFGDAELRAVAAYVFALRHGVR